MDAHRARTEVLTASTNGEGWNIRFSATLNESLLYYARRVQTDSGFAYVRVAMRLSDLNSSIWRFYIDIALATGACMLLAAVIAFLIARRQIAPIVEITQFADDLAKGQLQRRIVRNYPGEPGTLARSLNSMADNIARILGEAEHDRAEMQGILASMTEGVIATDTSGRIILVNAAAARLLDFGAESAKGHALWEVIRNEALVRSFDTAVSKPQHREFVTTVGLGNRMQVIIAPLLHNSGGSVGGLIIVLHDVTQAMRYQELRTEFVANVSHELRTPLTVIKGYIETLRSGAVKDPARAQQYLATVERHADQLRNLVDDLLEISRLEGQTNVSRHVAVDINATVRSCAEMLTPAAAAKQHEIALEIGTVEGVVQADLSYIERAVNNLIENAIKYTPAGGKITIRTLCRDHMAVIEVEDNGIGIPAEDQQRIFERFYRVDRSRSREMGGTGLGLSIVKHIVQSHGGRVEVKSSPGKGSCFSILLPMIDPATTGGAKPVEQPVPRT